MSAHVFDKSLSLSYLGLPQNYKPSPQVSPIAFLGKHLSQLPPHLLSHFSYITAPKERTIIPTIRNRRLQYASNNPPELRFDYARREWPNLWQGRERRSIEEADDEREWANKDFLQGSTKHVGNLGTLLGEYEQEREAQRVRLLRVERAVIKDFMSEEEESSDEEDGIDSLAEQETFEEAKESFERVILEHFIYGSLEGFDYEKVDWDELLDAEDDREAEERWFDEEDDDEQ